MQERGFAEEGQFLPLGVWKAKGFDGDAIERNALAGDKAWDAKWGWWTYRVVLYSDFQRQSHRSVDNVQVLTRPFKLEF